MKTEKEKTDKNPNPLKPEQEKRKGEKPVEILIETRSRYVLPIYVCSTISILLFIVEVEPVYLLWLSLPLFDALRRRLLRPSYLSLSVFIFVFVSSLSLFVSLVPPLYSTPLSSLFVAISLSLFYSLFYFFYLFLFLVIKKPFYIFYLFFYIFNILNILNINI